MFENIYPAAPPIRIRISALPGAPFEYMPLIMGFIALGLIRLIKFAGDNNIT